MTSSFIVLFIVQRPFEPFTITTADGREFHVPHPEYVGVGLGAQTVRYMHPNGQIEILDAALIVSIRTIYAADLSSYSE